MNTTVVVNLNRSPMFELHRSDCTDIAKARRAGLGVVVLPVAARPVAELLGNVLYGDPDAVVESDLRKLSCLK